MHKTKTEQGHVQPCRMSHPHKDLGKENVFNSSVRSFSAKQCKIETDTAFVFITKM